MNRAEGIGVVAVGDGGCCSVAHEGGAGIVGAYSDGHLGGSEKAVADVDGAVAPADEAAARVGRFAEQTAVEDAALDVEGIMASFGYESAVRAVALDTTIDGDAAEAVGDVGGAVHLANEPGGVLRAGGDGAADGAVLDGERAPLATNEAAGVGGGGVDVDDDVKVADGGWLTSLPPVGVVSLM